MVKIIKLIFVLMIFPVMVLSQGVNNLWMMGKGGSMASLPLGGMDMDFISGTPMISYLTREMEFRRAVSNICDNSGNLLFVTNGVYIADATGDTMQNGSGLNLSSYTSLYSDGLPPPQMNIIIPDPGNAFIYYLFHCTVDDPPGNLLTRYLYYSVIDMTANGGLGEIMNKNQVLLNDSLNAGKLTACKHANGRDWWILCHKAFTNTFKKFLITPYGISGPFTQNIGTIRAADAAQVQFSPDGTKLAYYGLIEDLDVFGFNRCTGMLSNPESIAINDSATAVGVTFSPNSQYLYVSSTNYVYQFDVTSTNILGTQTTVAVWDGFYSPNPPFATKFDIAQLASDGKIYIATGNSTLHLHVINQPDSAGLACDLVQHGIPLPAFNYNSLPNHPNYFLGALVGSPCDTLTSLANELYIGTQLNAFPNPTIGIFTLDFKAQKDVGVLEIFDALGRSVYKEIVAQWSQVKKVDISDFPSGIYYCRVKWKEYFATVKVIKE